MDPLIKKNCEGVHDISDDLIVNGATEEEHDIRLHNLMTFAKKEGFRFNSEKWVIKTQVSLFGILYTLHGLLPDPKMMEDILQIPVPQDLQRFLGMANMSPWVNAGTYIFIPVRNNYIIISDYYSRYPVLKKLSSLSASATISATKEAFSILGTPREIMSENGLQFQREYNELCEQWNICHTTNSPRYPKSNGFIECRIQYMLCCCCLPTPPCLFGCVLPYFEMMGHPVPVSSLGFKCPDCFIWNCSHSVYPSKMKGPFRGNA